ncbi:MAG: DNA-binding protein [Thauera sp.]|nr:MAG: DNA-binding protein [Thauera sp.]
MSFASNAHRYTTTEAAVRLRYQPQTLRREYCQKGHFCGIKPVKLPSGRLLWPADEIDALSCGERS